MVSLCRHLSQCQTHVLEKTENKPYLFLFKQMELKAVFSVENMLIFSHLMKTPVKVVLFNFFNGAPC